MTRRAVFAAVGFCVCIVAITWKSVISLLGPQLAPRFLPTSWQENFLGCISRTKYSVDYDESRFQTIKPGMSDKEVLSLVGSPLDVDGPLILWKYEMGDALVEVVFCDSEHAQMLPVCRNIHVAPSSSMHNNMLPHLYALVGLDTECVRTLIGEPSQSEYCGPSYELWRYSATVNGSHYVYRAVRIDRTTRQVECLYSGAKWK